MFLLRTRHLWHLGTLAVLCCLAWSGAASAQAPSRDLLVERPCGPDSMKGPIRYLIPQGFGRTDFRPTCNNHDRCYARLGSSRKQCDDAWRDEMLAACESSRCRLGCRMLARFMHRVVSRFGDGAFAEAQKKAAARAGCGCGAVSPGYVVVQPSCGCTPTYPAGSYVIHP
jgi:hypothetical protein